MVDCRTKIRTKKGKRKSMKTGVAKDRRVGGGKKIQDGDASAGCARREGAIVRAGYPGDLKCHKDVSSEKSGGVCLNEGGTNRLVQKYAQTKSR